MVRIMRIVSICAVVLAFSSAGLVGMEMFNESPEKPEILTVPDIVELYISQKKTKKAPTKESPLVAEARKFSLGIDPPPPPPPPTPVNKTATTKVDRTRPPKPPETKVTGPKPPPVNVSYKVLATVAYADQPDKSLALLDLTSIGQKWMRIGEKINHDTIEKIEDGHIVVSMSGKEQEVPITRQNPVLKFKSLLKSEQDESAAATSVVGSPVMPGSAFDRTRPASTRTSTSLPPRTPPGRSKYTPATSRTSNRTGSSFAPRPNIIRKPPPVPSPKQQKEMLDDNISDIKKLMGNSSEGLTEKEKAEEMKAWKELLEILEKEKINIDGSDKKPPSSTNK